MNLGAAGSGDSAYGLINRGTITASGLYADVDARAVQLGVTGGSAAFADKHAGNGLAEGKAADGDLADIGGDVG